MSYTVIYYVGGKQSGQWQRSLPVATEAEAKAQTAEIERAGRPALWHRTEVWDAVNLPQGAPFWWDFNTLTSAFAA